MGVRALCVTLCKPCERAAGGVFKDEAAGDALGVVADEADQVRVPQRARSPTRLRVAVSRECNRRANTALASLRVKGEEETV